MNQSMNVLWFVLVILIIFSGLFSAVETAYSSCSRIKLKNFANDNRAGAKEALMILENYDKFISTILIGNNIVNIVSATIGTIIFTTYFGEESGPTISTIFMTLVVLIFAEITPKTLAKQMPERFAMRMNGFVMFFEFVLTPLSFLFNLLQIGITKLMKVEDDGSDIQDELITMVDEAEKEGDLEEHESDLISAAIEFNDLDVGDVLTPRVNVVAIDIGTSAVNIEKAFRMNSYSRLPVYENSIDNIVGVIHEKDFYSMLYQEKEKTLIRKIIKPVIYTSENVKISTLLKQLQKEKFHLAVVLDEYGGTSGIITLEDIIEELVGEIWDEHDTVKEYYEKVNDTTYLVKCGADVEDMFERFAVDDDDEDYDFITVSGWVIHELEHIPHVGEKFDYKNLHVTVTKADQRKVIEVKVEIEEMEEQEDD